MENSRRSSLLCATTTYISAMCLTNSELAHLRGGSECDKSPQHFISASLVLCLTCLPRCTPSKTTLSSSNSLQCNFGWPCQHATASLRRGKPVLWLKGTSGRVMVPVSSRLARPSWTAHEACTHSRRRLAIRRPTVLHGCRQAVAQAATAIYCMHSDEFGLEAVRDSLWRTYH